MSLPRPNVLLRGGPVHLPARLRLRHVGDVADTLKLPVGNAYEHFRPTTETVEKDGERLRVFEWVRRTYVAE
ncbi:DUF5988 family protein [Streptomyces mayteni]